MNCDSLNMEINFDFKNIPIKQKIMKCDKRALHLMDILTLIVI